MKTAPFLKLNVRHCCYEDLQSVSGAFQVFKSRSKGFIGVLLGVWGVPGAPVVLQAISGNFRKVFKEVSRVFQEVH